jgi:hypothetical protein
MISIFTLIIQMYFDVQQKMNVRSCVVLGCFSSLWRGQYALSFMYSPSLSSHFISLRGMVTNTNAPNLTSPQHDPSLTKRKGGRKMTQKLLWGEKLIPFKDETKQFQTKIQTSFRSFLCKFRCSIG